ncbi:phosphatase PAP2 family protein [Subtercola sp. YIM 133946]|uniref:phosphatase PAP2 family protein n=1 Tax=Subtercola sp. YIM 133946 TaxID=3118909 RepID=UPI002F938B4F
MRQRAVAVGGHDLNLPFTFVGGRDVTKWRSLAGGLLVDRYRRVSGPFTAHQALAGSLILGGVIAAATAGGAAAVYDAVTDKDGIEGLDKPALKYAKKFRSRPMNAVAAGISRVFGPTGMPVLALTAGSVLAIRQRQLSPLILLVAAGAGSLGMTLAGKRMMHRNRPAHRDAIAPYEKSPSFPSGHALNATTILGSAAYLLVLRQQHNSLQTLTIAAAAGTALTVGLSRVLLGAHWFTDVMVAWTTGAGWLSLIVTAHRLYLTTTETSPLKRAATRQ